MKKLAFSSLYAIRLSIDDVLGLIKATINLALVVENELGDLSAATLRQLIADNKKFEPMVNNPRQSEFTVLINQSNKERKERFAEIKRTIKLHLKGRNATKKAAAKTLDFFFTSYWSMINAAMNSLTGIISQLLEKYQANIELNAAAATIGVDTLLLGLEVCNKEFDTIYNRRLTDDAAHEFSASDQKSTICDSYNEFCNAIEKAANFTPKESILNLFKSMDELRREYHTLSPNGKDKGDDEPRKEHE